MSHYRLLWQVIEPYNLINRGINVKHFLLILLFGSFLSSAYASSTSHQHGQPSPYAGQETRPIKSLSAEDIDELSRGGGWGLAKVAELNGVPGPAHLLELKEQIPLSNSQVTEITDLYLHMKTRAIELGNRLISLEQQLEQHFRQGTVTDQILRDSLADISRTRQDLRYTHLSTHLVTPGILSEEQIRRYNLLRGYDSINPCDTVPEGHNADMWRRHNGCQ